MLDSMRNPYFVPLGAILLWRQQFSFAVESWRAECGPALEVWLQSVGEMEALSSFARFSFEHPADPFPEITEDGPCFDGEELGHPLLPEKTCVRNNLRLDRDMRMMVISGSNMSGKSTLLRTAGVNTVLALAGATVRASRLRVSPLSLGVSLHILDSLQSGASHFYAEITRLRLLMDTAGGRLPLLFLLDEILHGTNSSDRQTGAEAVVRGYLERGAIGLITTHDLALARIADSLAPHAANVHFEDHLENGRIAFDYRIRPGIIRKSNAIALMRAVGLEV
jgi:DNA mismatch repair ATPase MutS